MADNQREVEHVLVTGATGGIGKAIATDLVKKGKNVYVTGRSQIKLNALLEELNGVKQFDEQTILSFCVDLCHLKSAQDEMPAICELPIDTVIFNAGVLYPEWKRGLKLRDLPGLEETIKANVLGHFVMARHLLRDRQENHRALPPLRFVLVSSVIVKGASFWPYTTNWPEATNQFEDSVGAADGWFCYSDGWVDGFFDAKLAAISMAQLLNEQPNTSAVAIHPGVARTEGSCCAEGIFREAVVSNEDFGGKWICNGLTDIPTNVNDIQKDSFIDFIRRLTNNFI